MVSISLAVSIQTDAITSRYHLQALAGRAVLPETDQVFAVMFRPLKLLQTLVSQLELLYLIQKRVSTLLKYDI